MNLLRPIRPVLFFANIKKWLHFGIAIGLSLSLGMLLTLFTRPAQPAYAAGESCFASLGLTTEYSSTTAIAVQQAVDAASPGQLVKVAGTCPGVQVRLGLTQTLFISKPLTLRGGYTTTNWLTANPLVNQTTLDGVVGGGTGSFSGSPDFVNPSSDDYHLLSSSAAIDAGVDAGIVVDLDNDIRPQDAGFDIGAFEDTNSLDLQLTKIASDELILAGSTLTYTLSLVNSGPNTATTIMLTDTLPAQVSLPSIQINAGRCATPIGNILTCILGSPSILLVDGDDNLPDVIGYYTATLEALGYTYAISNAADNPDATVMANYDLVIWEGGEVSSPSPSDEPELAAYLDSGGKLFIKTTR